MAKMDNYSAKGAVLVMCLLSVFMAGVECQCWLEESSVTGWELLAYRRLLPLVGRRYEAEDSDHVYDYMYEIGICTDVGESSQGVGAIQILKNNGNTVVLGKYTRSSIEAGADWIRLQYGDGDRYSHHCGREPRKTEILFTCDPSATDDSPGMKMVRAENGKESRCYYLFELAHPAFCTDQSSPEALSAAPSLGPDPITMAIMVGVTLFAALVRPALTEA